LPGCHGVAFPVRTWFRIGSSVQAPPLEDRKHGTLLIDEIQQIPAPMQLQFAQFIESVTTNDSDLRLMTATSTDVFERVQSTSSARISSTASTSST
jgi:DNA-binding NtrC family response regulator